MNAEKTIPATFLGVIGLITYQSFKTTGTLPTPHRFVSGGAAYTMLFLLSTVAPELSAVMSLGLLIAVAFVPGILEPAQWKSVGFALPPGSSIGTFGPNGIGQPGTSGLNRGKGDPLPPGPIGTNGPGGPSTSGPNGLYPGSPQGGYIPVAPGGPGVYTNGGGVGGLMLP